MKAYFFVFIMALSTTITAGELDEKNMEDILFSKPNPSLSEQEKAGIKISHRWRGSSHHGKKPIVGRNGTIRFLYGSQQPSIVCAVLQVCDIELQPGEQVNDIQLGDSERWTVSPALTGSGPALANQIQHLIIKPQDVGLDTSLVVTTNRRTYHFQLRSHRTQYMTHVSFTYPEDATAQWDAIKAQQEKEKINTIIPQTGENISNLNFDYVVEGEARWKPVRVYNTGTKTIIQMPRTMEQTEAPVLLVLRKEGGIFTDEEKDQVNYSVQGDRYIIDSVFDKAVLIAGVGDSQDRVTITRGN